MRLTSEEFASRMIEYFKPVQTKSVPPSEIKHAEKVEKEINKKMEEEVKKVVPEEPVLEMADEPVDPTDYDNEVDNKEE